MAKARSPSSDGIRDDGTEPLSITSSCFPFLCCKENDGPPECWIPVNRGVLRRHPSAICGRLQCRRTLPWAFRRWHRTPSARRSLCPRPSAFLPEIICSDSRLDGRNAHPGQEGHLVTPFWKRYTRLSLLHSKNQQIQT